MDKSRKTKRKWEMVVYHLRKFDAGIDDRPTERHASAALEWALKWPNARSRKETALAQTVASVIRKRIGENSNGDVDQRNTASETLADMVAREARVRVVASVQRRWKDTTKTQIVRMIRDALADALRRGLR